MPRTLETPPERLLEAVGDRNVVTVADLRERLGVSERTVQRRLHTLVEAGTLSALGRGVYGRGVPAVTLGDEAQELVELIREVDAEAHLTGYDVLAGFGHQFTYEYAHLVYCQPSHLSGLASALSEAHWHVLPAGAAARQALSVDRTVVLRGQAHREHYPVNDHVAAPEKAWVDLLREVRRSGLSFDYGELGRLLNALERADGRIETLTVYARRAGYLNWVRATRGEARPATTEQRQLAAGYAA